MKAQASPAADAKKDEKAPIIYSVGENFHFHCIFEHIPFLFPALPSIAQEREGCATLRGGMGGGALGSGRVKFEFQTTIIDTIIAIVITTIMIIITTLMYE